MSLPFNVRKAEVRDIEALVRLRMELLHTAAALGVPTDLSDAEWNEVDEAVRTYFEEAIPSGKYCGVVAEAGREVVACGGIIFMARPPYQRNADGSDAYLMNMYTLPEWRGKGAGTAIVAELLKLAKDAGVKRVALDAEAKARGVYARAGFHPNLEAMEILI